MMRIRRTSKWRRHPFVEPDEIFLDSKNLPEFDTQQFEGRLEKPIGKRVLRFAYGAIVVIFICFGIRLVYLQIIHGTDYFARSERNSLMQEPLYSPRGVVYDRNGVALVYNQQKNETDDYAARVYTPLSGFGHILGYVSYPARNATTGAYVRTEYLGKDGIEKEYNDMLTGTPGLRITERDAKGAVVSENIENPPSPGANLTLSIDADLQSALYQKIAEVARDANYKGGAGVIMDINTGEIIALASYPDYFPSILSDGKDVATINAYFNDSRNPLLDRAVSGLYSPGSIVKPMIGIAGLTEGVITEHTLIVSHDYISIPNPYDPTQETHFKDFNKNNGILDIRHALKVSSNIFFYEVGGGYQNQPGIGITNIVKYTHMFGLGAPSGIDLPGEKSGVVPDPTWKAKNFPKDPTWRLGDTYHTAIGQYGFQVTPLQMVRVMAAVGSRGKLVTPHLIKDEDPAKIPVTQLPFKDEYWQAIQDGTRLVVAEGTATRLNKLPFHVAAKTGTAQVGVNNEFINSSAMTFFPYEQPRYASMVIMERGPSSNTVGATVAP